MITLLNMALEMSYINQHLFHHFTLHLMINEWKLGNLYSMLNLLVIL